MVIVGRKHPLAARRKLGLADLADQSWIIGPVELRSDSPFVGAFRAAGLPLPRCHVISGSLNARFALLASGQFITLMPSSYWHFSPTHPELKVLPVEMGRWHTPTMMLTMRNHTLSPAVLAFQDIVRELVKPLVEVS
jgi:DNA-binding transcriptional LysR family regulator